MNQQKPLFEIERKRKLEGKIEDFLGTLHQHGFTQQGELNEIDTYYSRPDVDFMDTVECLRIRERDSFAEMTYKPASTSATATNDGIVMKEETNLSITPSDVQTAHQLLLNIGMVPLVEVHKHRQTFVSSDHDGLVVAIDKIKGVGVFIETEITSSHRAQALKDINSIEKVLGISAFAIATKPYRDLCMEKGTLNVIS